MYVVFKNSNVKGSDVKFFSQVLCGSFRRIHEIEMSRSCDNVILAKNQLFRIPSTVYNT